MYHSDHWRRNDRRSQIDSTLSENVSSGSRSSGRNKFDHDDRFTRDVRHPRSKEWEVNRGDHNRFEKESYTRERVNRGDNLSRNRSSDSSRKDSEGRSRRDKSDSSSSSSSSGSSSSSRSSSRSSRSNSSSPTKANKKYSAIKRESMEKVKGTNLKDIVPKKNPFSSRMERLVRDLSIPQTAAADSPQSQSKRLGLYEDSHLPGLKQEGKDDKSKLAETWLSNVDNIDDEDAFLYGDTPAPVEQTEPAKKSSLKKQIPLKGSSELEWEDPVYHKSTTEQDIYTKRQTDDPDEKLYARKHSEDRLQFGQRMPTDSSMENRSVDSMGSYSMQTLDYALHKQDIDERIPHTNPQHFPINASGNQPHSQHEITSQKPFADNQLGSLMQIPKHLRHFLPNNLQQQLMETENIQTETNHTMASTDVMQNINNPNNAAGIHNMQARQQANVLQTINQPGFLEAINVGRGVDRITQSDIMAAVDRSNPPVTKSNLTPNVGFGLFGNASQSVGNTNRPSLNTSHPFGTNLESPVQIQVPQNPQVMDSQQVSKDTTIENILKSIGFNFELSKTMQEKAKRERETTNESQKAMLSSFGIDEVSSFMHKSLDDMNMKSFLTKNEKMVDEAKQRQSILAGLSAQPKKSALKKPSINIPSGPEAYEERARKYLEEQKKSYVAPDVDTKINRNIESTYKMGGHGLNYIQDSYEPYAEAPQSQGFGDNNQYGYNDSYKYENQQFEEMAETRHIPNTNERGSLRSQRESRLQSKFHELDNENLSYEEKAKRFIELNAQNRSIEEQPKRKVILKSESPKLTRSDFEVNIDATSSSKRKVLLPKSEQGKFVLEEKEVVKVTGLDGETSKTHKDYNERQKRLRILEKELSCLRSQEEDIFRKKHKSQHARHDPILEENRILQGEIKKQIDKLKKLSEESAKKLASPSSFSDSSDVSERKSRKRKDEIDSEHSSYETGRKLRKYEKESDLKRANSPAKSGEMRSRSQTPVDKHQRPRLPSPNTRQIERLQPPEIPSERGKSKFKQFKHPVEIPMEIQKSRSRSPEAQKRRRNSRPRSPSLETSSKSQHRTPPRHQRSRSPFTDSKFGDRSKSPPIRSKSRANEFNEQQEKRKITIRTRTPSPANKVPWQFKSTSEKLALLDRPLPHNEQDVPYDNIIIEKETQNNKRMVSKGADFELKSRDKNGEQRSKIMDQEAVKRKGEKIRDVDLRSKERGEEKRTITNTPIKHEEELKKEEKQKYVTNRFQINFEYFDAGGHWCKYCAQTSTVFIDHLDHLQSKKHLQKIEPFGYQEKPWNNRKPKQKMLDQSQKKVMVPFKGVEFLMPAQAFYCSLCHVFSGDTTNAEEHVKSDTHNEKYRIYCEENQSYEKRLALDKAAGAAVKSDIQEKTDKFNKNKKRKSSKEQKKSRRRSSSSDSSSSSDYKSSRQSKRGSSNKRDKTPPKKLVCKETPWGKPKIAAATTESKSSNDADSKSRPLFKFPLFGKNPAGKAKDAKINIKIPNKFDASQKVPDKVEEHNKTLIIPEVTIRHRPTKVENVSEPKSKGSKNLDLFLQLDSKEKKSVPVMKESASTTISKDNAKAIAEAFAERHYHDEPKWSATKTNDDRMSSGRYDGKRSSDNASRYRSGNAAKLHRKFTEVKEKDKELIKEAELCNIPVPSTTPRFSVVSNKSAGDIDKLQQVATVSLQEQKEILEVKEKDITLSSESISEAKQEKKDDLKCVSDPEVNDKSNKSNEIMAVSDSKDKKIVIKFGANVDKKPGPHSSIRDIKNVDEMVDVVKAITKHEPDSDCKFSQPVVEDHPVDPTTTTSADSGANNSKWKKATTVEITASQAVTLQDIAAAQGPVKEGGEQDMDLESDPGNANAAIDDFTMNDFEVLDECI